MIKCIVCDLDGTLIDNADVIEENTINTLRYYINQGIEFIIATGRDINMVKDLIDNYSLNCDLILNNGTQYINKEKTRNDLYPMNYESFKQISTLLHEKGYLLAIHTNNGKYSYYNEDDFWEYHLELVKRIYADKNGHLPDKTFTTKRYLRDLHCVKDADEIIHQGIKVLKIDARHKNIEVVKGLREQLNIPYLDISSSYEDNMEITMDQMNKGKMLSKIIKEKGYTKEEVAVFGDGINDISMLQEFTYSFAPQNASNETKQAAHYTLLKTGEKGAVKEGLDMLKNLNLL